MKCLYCDTYQDVPSNRRKLNGVVSERFCYIKQQTVDSTTESCEKLSLTGYVYCAKNSQRIHYQVCMNRYKERCPECVSCAPGQFIYNLKKRKKICIQPEPQHVHSV